MEPDSSGLAAFPFLFGGTFIEAGIGGGGYVVLALYFPSFSEGLSLRLCKAQGSVCGLAFPFLFGGTFIEACRGLPATPRPVISLPFRRDFH